MAPLLRACSTIARAGRTVLALRPPCFATAHAYFQVPALASPVAPAKSTQNPLRSGWSAGEEGMAPLLCCCCAAADAPGRVPAQALRLALTCITPCVHPTAGQVAAKTAPIALGSAGTTGAWGAAKIGSVPSCARRGVAGGIVLSPAFVDVACARLGAHLALAALHPATRPGARTFFTRFAQQRQLQSLEKDAAAYPGDAAKQAEYLKKLNTHDPEAVLRR
jgi:hypothetical protein